MKILFLVDTGGVPCIYAKYLRKLGHECLVIERGGQDKLGFMKFYKEKIIKASTKSFVKQVVKIAKDYDIVHITSQIVITPWMRSEYRNKPIVQSYSGTEVILKREWRLKKAVDKISDYIIVVTKDMLEYQPGAMVLPNPVDTDLFKPTNEKPIHDRYFTFGIRYLDMEKFKEYFKGWDYTIIDRDKDPVKFLDMPALFRKYKGYIDVKFDKHRGGDKPLVVRSLTGLQALACGLEVIDENKQILNKIPEQHDPIIATKKLEAIYTKLLR